MSSVYREAFRRRFGERRPAHPPMIDCTSCDERVTEPECDKSERGCGHHCNHSWSHDRCCWCEKGFA